MVYIGCMMAVGSLQLLHVVAAYAALQLVGILSHMEEFCSVTPVSMVMLGAQSCATCCF